jgi:hypothetical protein
MEAASRSPKERKIGIFAANSFAYSDRATPARRELGADGNIWMQTVTE